MSFLFIKAFWTFPKTFQIMETLIFIKEAGSIILIVLSIIKNIKKDMIFKKRPKPKL